ncbi:probable TonB-dependent receptor [Oceanospirillum sp. MED92]|nr:probable TonB-dependent receptor [Oceanospirillum sp. MED92] [Neptuniibacter caesariensis]
MLNAKHFPCAIMLLPLAIVDVNAETAQQDQMVITAKAPVTEADFAGSVTTVTAEEIQLSGATNILEAIQMVPGISVNSVSSQASGRNGISIRGMENNHTLILIDGRRISDTDTNVPFSDFQYNWVPLVAVERIEVVRGPMSNLYGSSALGGVINIITTNADKEWSTTVEAQLSKVDLGNGGDAKDFSLATSGTLGDSVDLSFAIEQQDSDAFQNSFPSGSSANKEGKDSRNLILKAGFNISENTRLGFNIVDSDDDRTQYPDTLSYTIKRNQTGLELSNSINGFDINTNIYRSTSDNDIESQAYVHKLEENVATVDLGGQLNEQHFLTAGVEYSNEEYHKDYDSTSSFEFKDKFKSWSAFAQDRFDLSDELTLTWGARYDDHQRFGNALSPKAYLNWDISDAWQIKTGYGEGFKAPAVKDASDAYNFEYTYPTAFGGPGGSPSAFQRNVFLGNSDLKEETSRTIEFGADYSQGKLNGGFTLFHSKVKDLIST